MGWRGTLRTIIAAQRAAERARVRNQRQAFRDYERQQRLSAKEQALYEKQFKSQQAREEVEAYERHIEWLSLHKEIPPTFDWHDVLNAESPGEPLRKTDHEDASIVK